MNMEIPKLTLSLLPGQYAVCRLLPDAPTPDWARGEFVSVTQTAEELSVVCEEQRVPDGVQCERGWRCFKVQGPLDFSLVGVLASLLAPLAEAGIPVFAVSTYDTDYILVREADAGRAAEAMSQR